MRTGMIVKKMGMTRLYLSDGTHVPVTVLGIDSCHVVSNKKGENDGYSVTLGSGIAKGKNVLKPQREAYAKIKMEPKKKTMEFKVSKDNIIEVGKELGAEHFVVGQYIDATGISIGKGFAGSMKRHNFKGLGASHGVSVSHRSHGSTGNSQDPGRVFKGKKMAGHMGSHKTTVQNLQVVGADYERGLLFIKGGVPGSDGSWLSLKDAVKKALPSDAPFPAGIKVLKARKDELDKAQSEEKPSIETKVEENSTESTKTGERRKETNPKVEEKKSVETNKVENKSEPEDKK